MSQATTPEQQRHLNQLARRVLPAVVREARTHWAHRGGAAELDEYVSCACAALTKALSKYDARLSPLMPYVITRARWAMLSLTRKRARQKLNPTRGIPEGASRRYTNYRARQLRCTSPDAKHDQLSILELVDCKAVGRILGVSDIDEHTLSSWDPEDLLDRKHSAYRVRAALSTLTVRQRDLLHRCYFDGDRFNVFAADSGITNPACSRLHQRALGALKKALQRSAHQPNYPASEAAPVKREATLDSLSPPSLFEGPLGEEEAADTIDEIELNERLQEFQPLTHTCDPESLDSTDDPTVAPETERSPCCASDGVATALAPNAGSDPCHP